MATQGTRSGAWSRAAIPAATLVWLILLAALVGLPPLTRSPSLGDDLTRNTVRLALLYYAAAVSLMLWLGPDEWAAHSGRGRLARWLWTLAWAAYVVHVGMAFHHVHSWSHAAAVEHTRQVSGVGEGIYVSHLFTLVWTADVLAWWLWPLGRATRPAWVGGALHGFMAFVVFNATVVFEDGWIRWAGAAMFAGLGALGLYRLRRR
jgi:hypothetical protein